MSYVISMDEEKLTDSLRVRISPSMKEKVDAAFNGQKISQQDGVIALIEFFLTLDDVGRALVLGQIQPSAEDIASLILRRLKKPKSLWPKDQPRHILPPSKK